MRVKTIILALALTGYASAQGVDEYNIPERVSVCFRSDQASQEYEILGRLNPFYLRGDFNDDGVPDYAVHVAENSSGRDGIAICDGAGERKLVILGPQVSLPRDDGYVYQDFDIKAWRVFEKRMLHGIPGDRKPLELRNDSIIIEWPEMGSGIIYWDGTVYRWYHLGG